MYFPFIECICFNFVKGFIFWEYPGGSKIQDWHFNFSRIMYKKQHFQLCLWDEQIKHCERFHRLHHNGRVYIINDTYLIVSRIRLLRDCMLIHVCKYVLLTCVKPEMEKETKVWQFSLSMTTPVIFQMYMHRTDVLNMSYVFLTSYQVRQNQ